MRSSDKRMDRRAWPAVWQAVAILVLGAGSPAAPANGLGENGSWQFQTTQDKVNKGAVVDLVERKKAGFYDAIKTTVNNVNTTNIDKQFNCAVTATTTGNSGSNGMTAATSSPSVSNSSATNATTNANTASNGVSQGGVPGVIVAGLGGLPAGAIDNTQSNSGTLSSGVTGSTTSAATGAVSAGGGRTDQVLNSQQTNAGTQMASVNGSTACVGPLLNSP